MHQVYPLEHAITLLNEIKKNIPVDLQNTVLAVDKTCTCSFLYSQYCICEQINFLYAKFLKRPHRRQSIYESVNSRSRLHKAPQTETHDTYLLCHTPTCTLWISMSIYGPSLSPFISEGRHSSVASPIDQLFLPQQGSLKSGSMCFLLQPCDQQSSVKEQPAAARQYFCPPPAPLRQIAKYPAYHLLQNYRYMHVTVTYIILRSSVFSIMNK